MLIEQGLKLQRCTLRCVAPLELNPRPLQQRRAAVYISYCFQKQSSKGIHRADIVDINWTGMINGWGLKDLKGASYIHARCSSAVLQCTHHVCVRVNSTIAVRFSILCHWLEINQCEGNGKAEVVSLVRPPQQRRAAGYTGLKER